MPYSGKGDASLPDHVKKLSDSKRSQWVEVFNSAYTRCQDKDGKDCEGSAFRQANGVVKGKKSYVSGYEVETRQVSQADAGYSPTGGLGEAGMGKEAKACAGCQWYVSPDGCVVVAGDISPTGLSNMYLAKVEYKQPPIEVTIVGDDKAAKKPAAESDDDDDEGKADGATAAAEGDGYSMPGGGKDEDGVARKRKKKALVTSVAPVVTVAASVRSFLAKLGVAQEIESSPIVFLKQADGRTRYLLVSTNCFKDREGEIITTEAHEEFVNYVEKRLEEDGVDEYPELWLWHAPGSRIGKADWMDVCSGMRCTSGLIDAEKEYILDRLDEETLGASHGFHGVITKSKHIVRYRSYEDSLLPREEAANLWTGVSFVEESTMAFSEKRKKWLADRVGSVETVEGFEKAADSLAASLKAQGIQYKSVDEEEEASAAAAAAAEATVEAEQAAQQQELAEGMVKELTTLTGVMKAMADASAALAARIEAQDARIATLSKSDDEKVAAVLAPKVTPNGAGAGGAAGHVASESDDNVVAQQKAAADTDWWGQVVVTPALRQIGG
jgi:cation transport regulator ChaB